MIHSDIIKSLSEDEKLLLYAVGGFIFERLGYGQVRYEWIKMLKVDRVIEVLNKLANLKEEYYPVRGSLIEKIKDRGGF